jgi:hypothetical protein
MGFTFDWKHFVLSHLIWIVAFVVAVVGVQSWHAEHDARLVPQLAPGLEAYMFGIRNDYR